MDQCWGSVFASLNTHEGSGRNQSEADLQDDFRFTPPVPFIAAGAETPKRLRDRPETFTLGQNLSWPAAVGG